jgi:hypothetical protein
MKKKPKASILGKRSRNDFFENNPTQDNNFNISHKLTFSQPPKKKQRLGTHTFFNHPFSFDSYPHPVNLLNSLNALSAEMLLAARNLGALFSTLKVTTPEDPTITVHLSAKQQFMSPNDIGLIYTINKNSIYRIIKTHFTKDLLTKAKKLELLAETAKLVLFNITTAQNFLKLLSNPKNPFILGHTH